MASPGMVIRMTKTVATIIQLVSPLLGTGKAACSAADAIEYSKSANKAKGANRFFMYIS